MINIEIKLLSKIDQEMLKIYNYLSQSLLNKINSSKINM